MIWIVAVSESLVVLLGGGHDLKSIKDAMTATHLCKESLVSKFRDGKGSAL